MELKELKDELLELHAENNLSKMFKILKPKFYSDSKARPLFRQLRRRYNKNFMDKIGGTIKRKKAELEENRIGSDLVDFVNALELSDLDPKVIYQHREITNPILVFTREEDLDYLSTFFVQLNFSNVIVKDYSDQNYSLDKFDFVIFDNQDLPLCGNLKHFESLAEIDQLNINNRIEKMEEIIMESSKIIIHFGDFLFWISNKRDRVQPANSQFSLHARTKEVIDFINTAWV